MCVRRGRIPAIMSGFDSCRSSASDFFSTVSTSRLPSLLKLQFSDSCHIHFVFSWLHVFKNQFTDLAIRWLLFPKRRMIWEERHSESFQGDSQGCSLTARAHDFLWISQRRFQSSSSQSASYPSARVPCSYPACSLPTGWVGSCLYMQQVGKCSSANAAENKDCREALGFLQSQLLQLAHCPCSWAPELGWGHDRSEWQEPGSRQGSPNGLTCHRASSSSYDFRSHGVLPRKREEVPLLIFPPPPSHSLPTHSPWDDSSNQITLREINSENWPSGNLTLYINKYAS